MPITSNLINVAKGLGRSSFVRSKLQQDARAAIRKQVETSLNRIKADAFSKMGGYNELHHAAQTAEQDLHNVHPPMSRAAFDAAAHNDKVARQAVQKFEVEHEAAARQDRDLVALSRLKIKEKFGFRAIGNEYARIKSLPELGVKHPVVKANLPVLGDQPVSQYVQGAHELSKKFIDALGERSRYVSPRLAAQGRDVEGLEKSIEQYKESLNAFSDIREGEVLSPAAHLRARSVHVKVLQDGAFRIKSHSPEVGKLTAKIKPAQDKSMKNHITEGLEAADRITDALHQDSRYLSRKMLRNNFIQRHVDFKGLANFEAAEETLFDNGEVIQRLKEQGIQVKVLRNGTFRMERFNDQDQLVKTRHIPLARHSDMRTHVQNGLIQAQALAGQELPEKIPVKQQLKNTFSPFKKAILKAIN